IPQAECAGDGKAALRLREGSLVQAIPGVGGRAKCTGTGTAGAKTAVGFELLFLSQDVQISPSGSSVRTLSSRFNAAWAASRCSGVMWVATIRIAVASTAAS